MKAKEGLRKVFHQIGSNETVPSEARCRSITGKGVERNTHAGRLEGRISLCQQSKYHTRQHITATGSRHTVVAPRTAGTPAVGREKARPCPLHDHSHPLPCSHFSHHPAAVFLIFQQVFQRKAEQTGKFSKVGREYRTFRKQIP